MKNRNKLFLGFLFYSITLFSQSSTITVVYKQGMQNFKRTKSYEVKILKDLEYKLVGNNVRSEFKWIKKMNSDAGIANKKYAFKSVDYEDRVKKEKLSALNLFGSDYIVKRPYNKYKWKLTKTIKIIGGYTCYKALVTVKEARMTYDVIAWFAPDIPFSYGPRGYSGLPGLVLEVNWNGHFLIAKNIIIKKNSKIKIKRPSFGIEITENEINAYVEKMIKKYTGKKKKL